MYKVYEQNKIYAKKFAIAADSIRLQAFKKSIGNKKNQAVVLET
jgi:hypothetical protein